MSEQNTKPGFKTSEFWLSFVTMIVGMLMGSGVLDDAESDSIAMKAVGAAVAVLASLGYTVSRWKVKQPK